MNLTNKIFIYLSVFTILACSNDDDTFTQVPVDSGTQTNVYPLPPEQWLGETDPYYTSGYVGDIMPYYNDGKFNLFFLHDAKTKPAGKGFHDIHNFETTDFTEFNYKGRMIPYGASDEPDFGVGTGSVVKVGETYYFYYTGHNGNTPFVQNNPRESVLCATSTDLENWTKIDDFKITAPAGYLDFDFRDPHVFYNEEDGKYWMLMSTQTAPARKAVVLLFTSDDPATNNWTVQKPIYTTTPQENYLMLECADIFKMGAYWYLIFSENWSNHTGTHYRIANSPNGPWTTPALDRFDGSYLYAAKTASDGNKRYLFGWTARKSPENNTGNKEWGGNIVTHEIIQNNDGTLGVKQPESIAPVYTNNATLTVENTIGTVTQNNNTFTLDGTSNNALVTFNSLKKSNHIDFKIEMQSNGDFGVLLNHETESNTAFKIAFEPGFNRVAAYNVNDGNDLYLNHVPFNFTANTEYKVSITTNEDICVLYINDEVAFSNRLYDVTGKKWSFFSENNQTVFSNLTLKNPY
ncbi:glycoside hydrolase domain-containing protein [Wenyingzhuangia sp. IMCC45467]